MGRLGAQGRVPLAQGREVVQDPEGPALGGDHQIRALHLQVRDGHGGQVQLQGLPVLPVVEGDEKAALRACVEQAAADRVLAQHPHEGIRRQALHGLIQPPLHVEDDLPGIKQVSASYQKGRMVVEFDETKVSDAQIMAAVEKRGYQAFPL